LGFGVRLGGGVEVYLTQNIFLDAGAVWAIPFGNFNDYDHLLVVGAVGYRF
jgi:hypothetical protein